MAKSIGNSKNVIVDSTITAAANVHVGDVTYHVNTSYTCAPKKDWLDRVSYLALHLQ